MGISGKYDFKGIQKAGRSGINALVAGTGWGAALLKSPFAKLTNIAIELLFNWAANRGLVFLNLGVNFVKGEIDQKAFDKAFHEAISKIEVVGKDNLTPEQGKAIDEAIKRAADRFLPFNPN